MFFFLEFYQTIVVPIDVMSQHMMLLGYTISKTANAKHANFYNPLGIVVQNRSRVQIFRDIARTIYVKDGARGFYRGYLASLFTYVPSSASWLTFYHFFQVLIGVQREIIFRLVLSFCQTKKLKIYLVFMIPGYQGSDIIQR